MSLRAERKSGSDTRTVLARQAFCAPFHLSKPYEEAGVLQVQIVNPTAGILEGDSLQLDIEVGEGANLSVSTPAASRAFRCSNGGGAVCRQRFSVEKGACLEYLPEPLYPHAGSDYEQHSLVKLETGGSLFFVDTLAPGRAARGELWLWKRLVLTLELQMQDRIVLRERLDMSGEQLASLAGANGFKEAWFATALVVSPKLTENWGQTFQEKLDPRCRCGVTCLERSFWVVRLVTPSPVFLREGLIHLRNELSSAIPVLTIPHRKF